MRYIILALFSFFSIYSIGQTTTISGVLTEKNGSVIPFANVYINKTTTGTTTNIDGEFTLTFNKQGSEEIVFQYIGFEKKKLPISFWNNNNKPTITLKKESVSLSTFTVTASGKDPAYAIIKKAQKKRKYYLKQIEEYSGRVYMKGGAYLTEIPESFPLIADSLLPDSNDLGLMGLTESVANFHFKQPNNYKEEMIASKISGFSQGYSWNRANQVIYNFYEQFIKIEGISDRGFLSPVAPTATASYNFKLEGVFSENGHSINKIKVTPKRSTDLLFHGYIYITEELWNIYALDLYVSKPSPLQLADTVKFKQGYVPIKDDIWLPRSLEMQVYFKFFGFGIDYHAIGMFSNYNLKPNFEKNFFSNEVLLVTDTVKKIDSTFWDTNRQIVLSNDEVKNYHKGDSIEQRMNSKEYLDSLDTRTNKFDWTKAVLTGYTYRNRHKKLDFTLAPMLTGIQFNVVEGLVINPTILIRNYKKNKQQNKLAKGTYLFGLRYAFVNDTYSPRFGFSRQLNAKKLSGFNFTIGQNMSQVNNANPIAVEYDTYYVLSSKRNWGQFYQSRYAKLNYQRELFNGILGGIEIGYEQRLAQNNRTDFTWSKKHEDRAFFQNLTFNDNNVFKVGFSAKIALKQKYETYPDKKVVLGTNWPIFYIFSNHGVAINSNDANYHQLKFAITDDYSFGNLGRLYLTTQTGKFLSQKNTTIVDYEHFNGNQMLFTPRIPSRPFIIGSELESQLTFHTLPFYSYSTTDAFIEAHVEHHFNGFIINKIPLVRKLKFQTVAGVNALYTETEKEFTELYIGLENIFSIVRVDVAAGYNKTGLLNPVLRIALNANF